MTDDERTLVIAQELMVSPAEVAVLAEAAALVGRPLSPSQLIAVGARNAARRLQTHPASQGRPARRERRRRSG